MPGYWGIRIAAAVYIVFCFYVGAQALEFPAGGGTFPLFAEVCAVLISGIMIVQTLWPGARDSYARLDFSLDYARAMPLLLCALAIVYVLVIFELGYFTATLLFLFAATWLVGIRDLRIVILTAVILLPAMYGFFIMFLKAPLPKGILF
jgi:hypothetical protein